VKQKKENQRSIIAYVLNKPNYFELTAKNISLITGIRLESVNGRINEMLYKYQTVKIVGTNDGCHVYRLRMPSDPLNHRPKSQAEILAEKLEAVRKHCRLTEREVNEIHNEFILSKLQTKME